MNPKAECLPQTSSLTFIFVLPVRFNVVLSVHAFSLVESPFSRIRGRDSPYEQLSQCLDSGAHLGCTALLITLRLCSRYREFPTT